MGDDPRVGPRQVTRVADVPRERDDEQEERHRRQRAEPAGERSERGHERKQVAIEVRLERQEIREVDDDEGAEDEVGARAL